MVKLPGLGGLPKRYPKTPTKYIPGKEYFGFAYVRPANFKQHGLPETEGDEERYKGTNVFVNKNATYLEPSDKSKAHIILPILSRTKKLGKMEVQYTDDYGEDTLGRVGHYTSIGSQSITFLTPEEKAKAMLFSWPASNRDPNAKLPIELNQHKGKYKTAEKEIWTGKKANIGNTVLHELGHVSFFRNPAQRSMYAEEVHGTRRPTSYSGKGTDEDFAETFALQNQGKLEKAIRIYDASDDREAKASARARSEALTGFPSLSKPIEEKSEYAGSEHQQNEELETSYHGGYKPTGLYAFKEGMMGTEYSKTPIITKDDWRGDLLGRVIHEKEDDEELESIFGWEGVESQKKRNWWDAFRRPGMIYERKGQNVLGTGYVAETEVAKGKTIRATGETWWEAKARLKQQREYFEGKSTKYVEDNVAYPTIKVPLAKIDLRRMDAYPEEKTRERDWQQIGELSSAVNRGDVMTPIHVRKGENGKYVLVDGYHRYLAYKSAGAKEIPAYDEDTGKQIEIENLLVDEMDLGMKGKVGPLNPTVLPTKEKNEAVKFEPATSPYSMPGLIRPWVDAPKVELKIPSGWVEPINQHEKIISYGGERVGNVNFDGARINNINIDDKYKRHGLGSETVGQLINKNNISGEALPQAKRFWEKIGAEFKPTPKPKDAIEEYRESKGFTEIPFIISRESFEVSQLSNSLKANPPTETGPLNPSTVYPNEPSVTNPKFMENDEGRSPRSSSSDTRPYTIGYERPYFDAPSKFRTSIKVSETKSVPTEYFGWHPVMTPMKGYEDKVPIRLQRTVGDRPEIRGPTLIIEPSKDKYYEKRIEKEREEAGKRWDEALAKNKEADARGEKTRYGINTDFMTRDDYIKAYSRSYEPGSKVDVVGALAATDAVFDRKGEGVYLPSFTTKIKDSFPPGDPHYTRKAGHSNMWGVTMFRTRGEQAQHIPIHEVAHQIHSALPANEKSNWLAIHGSFSAETASSRYHVGLSSPPSVYASKNANEDFAESYVAFMAGKPLDVLRQQFMESIAKQYNLPTKEKFEEKFNIPVEYRSKEGLAELPDVSEKMPPSPIDELARAEKLSEQPGLYGPVRPVLEKTPTQLPPELVSEPTEEEIADLTIAETPEPVYSMESPLERKIEKPKKEPEADSSEYAGTEEEVDETVNALYGDGE
jgi:hypothetical protein